MKVLIVGAGIGGLSAYISLYKHLQPRLPSLSVRIVEAHETLSDSKAGPLASASTIVGSGLGLAPNGLRAIHSLSPQAAKYIMDRGFVDGASRMTFRNSSGQKLGVFSAGNKDRYGGFGMVMVSRAVVFESLLQAFEQYGKVEWGRKVVAVVELGAEGVQVEYADGTKEVVDLVIGADGVRSRVRDSLFKGKYPAESDGLMGAGGFIPVSLLPQTLKDSLLSEGKDEEGVVMTFGAKGFFGYSLCTPRSAPNEQVPHGPILQWWAIYETFQTSFTSSRPKTITEANEIKEKLLGLYGTWKSHADEKESVYRSIIELGCVSEEVADTLAYHHTPVLLLPRYVVPRRLESYTTPSKSGRIILLGDAAHAMPPDSGQGVSCALEDAVVYALLLAKYQARDGQETVSENVLRKSAAAYNDLRMPRVGKILDIAKYNGDSKKEKGVIGRWFRDLTMRVVCFMPESFRDSAFDFGYEPEKVVENYLSSN
ncbi:hypothetical protein JOM56_010140 [Amanita muscaria]